MNLASHLRALAFASLFCLPAVAGTMASEVDGTAKYVITLGGLNIASVAVDLNDNGSKFSLDLSASVSGLANFVASGTAKITSRGRSTARTLTPEQFNLDTRANGESFTVDVSYADGNVSGFRVNPPIVDNYNRVPIERKHLSGVTDMLSAFVLKGTSLDRSLCQRKMQIFTGVERFNIAMSFAAEDEATSPRTGYQGPVILCRINYTPVAGHFTTSEMTSYLAKSDRILIWYAPVGDSGYFIPYRVVLTTSIGDLSMVLTALRY
ncbi:DUF3108 domain-containing protein [Devosia rhodophyticola]|uniref:DUF3108 domain-containing protein n=1 Tax=Devosia rhodophyticola TaxID=3026423 RepID=A0ABY7YU01_9HYPH|nr:DUF3108 domain-containing protein [Devosia rhodophyticola]WDR04682.1 DUF3108 domain-containing protein [Devosia rhodophyticola]